MGGYDEQIGRNLGAVRARLTSLAPADLDLAMRVRGWSWPAGTTDHIEAGRRPLLLAESEDVSSIMGLSEGFLLGRTESDTADEVVSSLLDRASYAVQQAAELWFDVTDELRAAVDCLGLLDDAGPVTPQLRDRLRRWLAVTPETVLAQARVRFAAEAEPGSEADEGSAPPEEGRALDVQAGLDVARARSSQGTTRGDLASRLQERGWGWTAETVRTVEDGSRPLRLAEREDLEEVLQARIGHDSSGVDYGTDAYPAVAAATHLYRVKEAAHQLRSAVVAWLIADEEYCATYATFGLVDERAPRAEHGPMIETWSTDAEPEDAVQRARAGRPISSASAPTPPG
ncbi:hypothetical protein [Microlunatus antarcticus]|uniref:Uncharacterized protein n=1 Tax=Microlunatus antarcticus TaxID=53388 RepID=A0A7W5JUL0_9ACTN|nr:hypothetical protein [Microlunatus antarcticus]MBB3326634.1 hypothetical protein [Microlunatus antarcticus]